MASLYRFLRVVLILALVFVGAVVVPLKIFDADGLDRVERLQKELSSLTDGGTALKRENDLLQGRMRAFYADPDYIEKVARGEPSQRW